MSRIRSQIEVICRHSIICGLRKLSTYRVAPVFLVVMLTVAGQLYAAATESPRDVRLSAEAVAADLALAREALETIHAGYDRYTNRAVLDAQWASLEAEATDGMTHGELYLGVSRVLATIRCNHTKAELPDDMEAARKSDPTYLPFRYRFFHGRMFVTQAADGVDLAAQDEVLTIDGRTVTDLIADVMAVFPVDGDTDYVKEHLISSFGEFIGPAFEHFMPFLYAIRADAELTVRRENGAEETLRVRRLTFDNYAAITDEKRFGANFFDAVRFETLGDDAAYLAVDTFINYRKPVKPDSIYKPIFEQLRREGRTKLIVDLRRNGGGSDDAAWGLFRWLIREPVQPTPEIWTRFAHISPELREHLSTWEPRALRPDPSWFDKLDDKYYRVVAKKAGAPGRPLKPKRGAFDGKVVMLTSNDNASGVTHLLAALRGVDRATFIGEPTGGASTGATAGVIAFLTLPESGIRVCIPLQRTIMANANKLDSRGGVRPDIEVLQTRASAFAGEDPALAAAKAFFEL